jgi:hypothetical protein
LKVFLIASSLTGIILYINEIVKENKMVNWIRKPIEEMTKQSWEDYLIDVSDRYGVEYATVLSGLKETFPRIKNKDKSFAYATKGLGLSKKMGRKIMAFLNSNVEYLHREGVWD